MQPNSITVPLQIIVVIALTLSGSNLYGYVRCKLGKSDSITQSFKNMAAGLVQKQMVSNVSYDVNWILKWFNNKNLYSKFFHTTNLLYESHILITKYLLYLSHYSEAVSKLHWAYTWIIQWSW